MSASTALTFMADKFFAKTKRWRVAEDALLGLMMLGGSPGGLLGMVLAAHKIRKASFLLRAGAVVAAQAGLFYWVSRVH